jgi:hypothetical protein
MCGRASSQDREKTGTGSFGIDRAHVRSLTRDCGSLDEEVNDRTWTASTSAPNEKSPLTRSAPGADR